MSETFLICSHAHFKRKSDCIAKSMRVSKVFKEAEFHGHNRLLNSYYRVSSTSRRREQNISGITISQLTTTLPRMRIFLSGQISESGKYRYVLELRDLKESSPLVTRIEREFDHSLCFRINTGIQRPGITDLNSLKFPEQLMPTADEMKLSFPFSLESFRTVMTFKDPFGEGYREAKVISKSQAYGYERYIVASCGKFEHGEFTPKKGLSLYRTLYSAWSKKMCLIFLLHDELAKYKMEISAQCSLFVGWISNQFLNLIETFAKFDALTYSFFIEEYNKRKKSKKVTSAKLVQACDKYLGLRKTLLEDPAIIAWNNDPSNIKNLELAINAFIVHKPIMNDREDRNRFRCVMNDGCWKHKKKLGPLLKDFWEDPKLKEAIQESLNIQQARNFKYNACYWRRLELDAAIFKQIIKVMVYEHESYDVHLPKVGNNIEIAPSKQTPFFKFFDNYSVKIDNWVNNDPISLRNDKTEEIQKMDLGKNKMVNSMIHFDRRSKEILLRISNRENQEPKQEIWRLNFEKEHQADGTVVPFAERFSLKKLIVNQPVALSNSFVAISHHPYLTLLSLDPDDKEVIKAYFSKVEKDSETTLLKSFNLNTVMAPLDADSKFRAKLKQSLTYYGGFSSWIMNDSEAMLVVENRQWNQQDDGAIMIIAIPFRKSSLGPVAKAVQFKVTNCCLPTHQRFQHFMLKSSQGNRLVHMMTVFSDEHDLLVHCYHKGKLIQLANPKLTQAKRFSRRLEIAVGFRQFKNEPKEGKTASSVIRTSLDLKRLEIFRMITQEQADGVKVVMRAAYLRF